MRNLASIQKILSLEAIPGADKIEKATVLGWGLVVKKGEFQVGDLCVYCEIDSILPELLPFEFLRSKKFRIKTQKIKDTISQGIAFPISVISEVSPKTKIKKLKEGNDVTEILKVRKWDPEEELEELPQKKSWIGKKFGWLLWKLGFKGKKFGKKIKRTFPTHLLPRSDETRVQNMLSGLIRHQGKHAYITEKCEGSSVSFVYNKKKARFGKDEEKYYVCSRNLIIEKEDDKFFLVSIKYDIEEKLKSLGRNLGIQAELIGVGIQGNIYKLNGHDIRVFNIYDIDQRRYVPYDEFINLTTLFGLPIAPIVATDHIIHTDIKKYVEMSKGKSMINPKATREGIVIRLVNEDFSFKSINPEYLLAQAKQEEKELKNVG